MKTFRVSAKVDQIVTRDVEVLVQAEDGDEALEKARLAINDYPNPIEDEQVLRVLVVKQAFWIPRSIEFDKPKIERKQT